MSLRWFISSLAISVSLSALGCRHGRPAAPTPPSPATASPSLTTAAGALVGAWQCNGSVYGPDGPSPSTATLVAGLALDGAWLQTELAVISGKYPYKFTWYRTFETSSRTWVTFIADNLSGHAFARSSDGITWIGTSTGPMGEMKIRDSETMLAASRMRMLGQYSLDGGDHWSTGYELSCAK